MKLPMSVARQALLMRRSGVLMLTPWLRTSVQPAMHWFLFSSNSRGDIFISGAVGFENTDSSAVLAFDNDVTRALRAAFQAQLGVNATILLPLSLSSSPFWTRNGV